MYYIWYLIKYACIFIARPSLFWVSSFMSLWSNILFNCAVIINLIVAFFYPFDDNGSSSSTVNSDNGQRRRMISGESRNNISNK